MFTWNEVQRDAKGKIVLLYRHQRIFDEGIIKPGAKVLDVGGWGMLAARTIEEGAQCVILDNFSEDQHYPERVCSLPYINGDILWCSELAYWGAGTYDVVACFEMLEHCKDQSLAVRNMHKMLKVGGWLVGTFPIPGAVHAAGEPGISFLSAEELVNLLKLAGFVDILVEPTGSRLKEERPCSLYFKARKKEQNV